MLSLTTPIVLRTTKLRVVSARGLNDLDADDPMGDIIVESGNATGVIATHLVQVSNGTSRGLVEINDTISHVKVATPTGLTDLRAAVAAASGRAAKVTAIETWLSSAGMWPAGTIT